MRLHYDEQTDALCLRLDDSQVIESEEVQPGVILDYDERGQVVGIELLGLKERVPGANLRQLQFEVA